VLPAELTLHPSARLGAGELHQLRWLACIVDFDLHRHPVLAVTGIERDLMRFRPESCQLISDLLAEVC
jgi:hypothetical protein